MTWYENDIVGTDEGPLVKPSAKPEQVPAQPQWYENDISGQDTTKQVGSVPVNDPNKSAGFAANFGAGMMTPEQRIPYFAARRFPDMPIEDAIKGYGLQGNDVFYTAPDGQRYYERAGVIDQLGRASAEAIPAIGGTAGFLGAGGVVNPVTGALGGAAGAAGARSAQMALGDMLSPVQSSLFKKLESAIGEGVLDMGGTVGGALIAKGIKPKILNAFKEAAAGGAETLMRKARAMGIDLSWAEASNLKDLIGRQQYLNRGPGSENILYEKYLARMPKIRNTVERFVSQLQGAPSGVQAADEVIGAAQSKFSALETARTNATKDIYQAAYQAAPKVSTANVRSSIKSAMRDATGDYKRLLQSQLDELGKSDMISSQKLHNMRKDIDRLMESGSKKFADARPEDLAKLMQIREPIDTTLKGIPRFAEADAIFQRLSGPINALKRETVGKLANKNLPDIKSIANEVFNVTDAQSFRAIRDVIRGESPEAWDSLVKWRIQTVWDSIDVKGRPGDVKDLGGRFVKALVGDKNSKADKFMRIALREDPDLKNAFQTLMDVLSATGRGLKEGSPTQPLLRQEADALAEAGRASPATRLAQSLRLVTPDAGPTVANWIDRMMLPGYNTKIANALFDPDFRAAMAEVRKVGPKTQTGLQIASRVILQALDAPTDASGQIGEGVMNAGQNAIKSGQEGVQRLGSQLQAGPTQ